MSESESELRGLSGSHLAEIWMQAVGDARRRVSDPASSLRRALIDSTALSPAGLEAALSQVFSGVTTEAAAQLLKSTPRLGADRRGPVVVLTSSNLPALAVQSFLPALAARRPLLVKSPSSEPFFAPAFVASLARLEPILGRALAALTWRGGDEAVEEAIFTAVDRVIAYGDEVTETSLRRRLGARLFMHGPKISLAVVGDDVDPTTVAPGLAHDIALFDQRGCLSVQGILVVGSSPGPAAEGLASHLARHLRDLRAGLPPGPAPIAVRVAIRQWRDEAIMAGAVMPDLPFDAGTVIVDTGGPLRPSPGGRCVRLRAVAPDQVAGLLAPWAGRLQGVALAGEAALALGPMLEQLGVTYLAPPGRLQAPDVATWNNGGVAPLEPYLS